MGNSKSKICDHCVRLIRVSAVTAQHIDSGVHTCAYGVVQKRIREQIIAARDFCDFFFQYSHAPQTNDDTT